MSSPKVFIAEALCHPVIGSAIGLVTGNRITKYGASFDLASPYISDRVKALLFWGLYESSEIHFVNKYLSGKYPVIELGGSIGIVSTVIGKKIGPQCLITVEANPKLVPIIENHLKCNKGDTFEVLHAGIGNQSSLYFVEGNDNTVGKVSTEPVQGSIAIPVKSLEELLIDNEIKDFTLVSDIEGAELSFIFESPGALFSCRELLIELHDSILKGKEVTVAQQLQQLEALGFQIVDRHGPVIFARK